jgi:lysophospholipase-2
MLLRRLPFHRAPYYNNTCPPPRTMRAALSSSSSSSSPPAPGAPQTLPQITADPERHAIVVRPAEAAPHTATVIGPIHGLGDSARGWLEGGLQFLSALPYCKFVLPDAPVAPVTLNGGFEMPSWYDIQGLPDRFEEDCVGIEESRARITALIEAEIATGIPASRIVVAGFSQGGALSLVSGLQFPTALAGVLVMSGYLAGAKQFELADAQRQTPVMHLHGRADPMVKYEWAEDSQTRVEKLGHENYTLKAYPELQHSVSEAEFCDAIKFLQERLPPQ